MTTFNPVLRGGVFTFEVGPDKVPFVIHKKVVEDNSEVLATLMNNGTMQESTTGIARLSDTDADTFALFAEFIYTGFYRMTGYPPSEHSVWFDIHCWVCKAQTVVPRTGDNVPKSCPSCHDVHIIVGWHDSKHTAWNVPTEEMKKNRKRKRTPDYRYNDVFQRQHTMINDTSEEAQHFKSRSYPALGRNRIDLKNYIASLQPSDLVTQNVSAHARLYVFSQKYMVHNLKKLCIHKLHRDLIMFNITSTSIAEIVELLTYTYDNTADEQDEAEKSLPVAASASRDIIVPVKDERNDTRDDDDDDDMDSDDNAEGSSSDSEDDDGGSSSDESEVIPKQAPPRILTDDQELRDLAMSYAVLNAQKLMQYPSFKDMVQEGGQLVSDFTGGITKRLAPPS